MLSWGVEAAEEHVSRGLALAVLALITVLPEFVVDFYYSFQGGRHLGSEYVQYAAANMTGANRLLVGLGWPAIVLLYWWRAGKRRVELRWDNAVEISFLALGSLYAFVIVLKGSIQWFDAAALFLLYAAYLWRLAKLPKEQDDDDEEEPEVGPGAALTALPRRQQFAIIGALALVAGAIIVFEAEPFAESLIGAATVLGVNKFLLIQWISPLAGELPEIIIMVLFTLSLRPGYALGALISDKINQCTLLVGALPLIYSLGAGTLLGLPLDARQHEEFFLTAAQSLFAVMLLFRLRFSVPSALILLALFLAQFGIALAFQHDEPRTIQYLTLFAWVYLLLASMLAIANRQRFIEYVRVGLFGQLPPQVSQATAPTKHEIG
ncbi:MAG: hypothetical protein ABIQ97_04475, partial [Lysobacteraceae bacterium]